MSTGQDIRNIIGLIMARKKANNQHIGPTILVGLLIRLRVFTRMDARDVACCQMILLHHYCIGRLRTQGSSGKRSSPAQIPFARRSPKRQLAEFSYPPCCCGVLIMT